MKSYSLYIDGQDVEGPGWTYVVRTSAFLKDKWAAFNLKRSLELGRDNAEITGDVIGRCARSDADQNAAALAAAHRASRTFRLLPLATRAQIAIDFNDAVIEHAEELTDIMIAEGHPRRLAQWEISGIVRGCDRATVEWYVKQMHQSMDTPDGRLELVRQADGVVCVNPPQNAAGSNSALGLMALLAGNAIVVKAPRTSPLSVMYLYRELLAPILERHGAPPGTLNLISGSTGPIIESWLASPLVNDILFFGDSAVGLQIGERCVASGKKPILELAGNDGFVVWRDADVDAAARALEECFYGSGQICMVPKYCIVHPEVADKFIDTFVNRARNLVPGYPEDDGVLLSPVIKVDKFFDFIAEAKQAGAELLCGGERIEVDGEPSVTGLFCQPTVMRIMGLQTAGTLSCVREETFFPLMPIVIPEDGDDAELFEAIVDFVNANEYGLRNSVWTGDPELAQSFARSLTNCGQLKINASHIGFVSYISTHGGTGKTGGPFGELNYVGLRTSHWQGVTWGDGDPRPLDDRVLQASRARVDA